ncbi:MAG: coenzyme A pyrophosphatase [Rhizobiaceae bacterium MnEN-MB40S]|nr:MAG: coenzyme A pyrophosphatase [Rhizobiaceae bacterium MnEN-MB40S]
MKVDADQRYSARALRDTITARPAVDDDALFGDHLLNPDLHSWVLKQKLRDAAVLVPFVDYGDHTSLLLTQRTTKMRTHSGQIAFPGGAIDPEDESPEAAAMREAEEEIGLSAKYIEPFGRLPLYFTATGFKVFPVLAIVQPGFPVRLNRQEVDDAFEVPLDFLMDPANHNRESKVWQGLERHYYSMPYDQRYIWGVTAGIIRTLYEIYFSDR